MKGTAILHWTSTALVALMSVSAGIMYFKNPEVAQGFTHFGFPGWFRVELGIAKVLGSLAILLPMVPLRVKEWAYAGLAITFLSAFIAHVVTDGLGSAFAPALLLGLLLASYVLMHKRRKSGPVRQKVGVAAC